MRTCLVDAGPFVSYLDRKDRSHTDVADFLDNFKGRLSTTGAVIGEVMYFVSELPNGPVSFAEFLIASDTHIASVAAPSEVLTAAELMHQYRDTPMDYADATLVLLADQTGTTEILTLDRRGFSTYRTPRGKAFSLILG
jgi:predicted nucleic acid-binding protein